MKRLTMFLVAFAAALLVVTAWAAALPAQAHAQGAGPTATPVIEGTGPTPEPGATFQGVAKCQACHAQQAETWSHAPHADAFKVQAFSEAWAAAKRPGYCLACHTTGYDPNTGKYAFEGVTCESCHGPFQPGHPQTLMPQVPDAVLCSSCHKTTTDEWLASPHAQANIQCQACHNPHSQTPRAASVTELCANCHKEMKDTFAHGTHAEAGLECSNCHMYTAPRSGDAIMGLVPTGHTFTVGSEACIGCHQDTVHTRDTIVRLSGQTGGVPEVGTEELKQQISQQEMTIQDLKGQSTVRLYTGLVQGAIVGLIIGGVAAWVVSKRITIVEESEEEE